MAQDYRTSMAQDGSEQVLRIPPEFAMSERDVILRKQGSRLVIQPSSEMPSESSLLSLLKSFSKIENGFPDVDENLQPLDDISL